MKIKEVVAEEREETIVISKPLRKDLRVGVCIDGGVVVIIQPREGADPSGVVVESPVKQNIGGIRTRRDKFLSIPYISCHRILLETGTYHYTSRNFSI
jgi:hypothetical protein